MHNMISNIFKKLGFWRSYIHSTIKLQWTASLFLILSVFFSQPYLKFEGFFIRKYLKEARLDLIESNTSEPSFSLGVIEKFSCWIYHWSLCLCLVSNLVHGILGQFFLSDSKQRPGDRIMKGDEKGSPSSCSLPHFTFTILSI